MADVFCATHQLSKPGAGKPRRDAVMVLCVPSLGPTFESSAGSGVSRERVVVLLDSDGSGPAPSQHGTR